jgi:hypothetical protein
MDTWLCFGMVFSELNSKLFVGISVYLPNSRGWKDGPKLGVFLKCLDGNCLLMLKGGIKKSRAFSDFLQNNFITFHCLILLI